MSAYAFGLQSKHPVGCLSHDGEHCRYDSVPVELMVPYNIAGRKADYTDPSEWMTFEGALTMLHRGDYDGIGIVIDRRFGKSQALLRTRVIPY